MQAIRRKQYQQAAEARMQDADVLRRNKRYHSMVYMLGFVLECALANNYCMKWNKEYIQDCKGYNKNIWFQHEKLLLKLQATGLHELEKDLSKFKGYWDVNMRYHPDDFINKEEKAEELYDLVIRLFRYMKQKTV